MQIKDLRKIGPCHYEIPKSGAMNVPAWIFADKNLLLNMDDKVKEQLINVACLPGIVRASMAMPDAHWGYGFPIGGVAAFDPDKGGIISVGGVGYDISCGVRTMITGLFIEDIKPKLKKLIQALYKRIPAGVGSEGKIKLSPSKLDEVLIWGAKWAIDRGYGLKEDLEYIEDGGFVKDADPSFVSKTAKERQARQVGTLGSGNHYLEIQYVDAIFCKDSAKALGLELNQIVISIHCGSRALGHQIGTDYLSVFAKASQKYNIPIRERELVCAPIYSDEGQRYFKAMCCGINCALANRQVISHLTRVVFYEFFENPAIRTLYDVSHNTCKVERHKVNGKEKELFVHRKGATRAFGPNRKGLPPLLQGVGQPVLIGGTMGTYSYILVGLDTSEALSFSSACHGAGRSMSRRQALKRWRGKEVINKLASKGILVMCASKRGAAEEAPDAYKDVTQVVNATHEAGLAKKVIRLRPLACIKG